MSTKPSPYQQTAMLTLSIVVGKVCYIARLVRRSFVLEVEGKPI